MLLLFITLSWSLKDVNEAWLYLDTFCCCCLKLYNLNLDNGGWQRRWQRPQQEQQQQQQYQDHSSNGFACMHATNMWGIPFKHTQTLLHSSVSFCIEANLFRCADTVRAFTCVRAWIFVYENVQSIYGCSTIVYEIVAGMWVCAYFRIRNCVWTKLRAFVMIFTHKPMWACVWSCEHIHQDIEHNNNNNLSIVIRVLKTNATSCDDRFTHFSN